jgi:molybdopterin-containing oxidoreductase family iron-sulfur binding subunit
MKPSEVEGLARAIAAALGRSGEGGGVGSAVPEHTRRFADAVAKDLQAHRGRSLVIAGDGQPPSVHALAHAMNQSLGNVGTNGRLHADGRGRAGQSARLAARTGGRHERRPRRSADHPRRNPVYTAPADLNSPRRSPGRSCAFT